MYDITGHTRIHNIAQQLALERPRDPPLYHICSKLVCERTLGMNSAIDYATVSTKHTNTPLLESGASHQNKEHISTGPKNRPKIQNINL